MRMRITLSSLFMSLVCSVAFGQDISSKITGTVTDASGAVISGATVTAPENPVAPNIRPRPIPPASITIAAPHRRYILKVPPPDSPPWSAPHFLWQ